MKKIRRIIKYSLEGITSTRRIADRVGISHTQVSAFLGRLSGSEYSFEELIELDDKALSEIASTRLSKITNDPSADLPALKAGH